MHQQEASAFKEVARVNNCPQIGIIGSRSCSSEIASIAERTGNLIATHKAILICGGSEGVMEAAARGAQAAGGLTVGILPGPSKTEANPFIDVKIPTDMGHARNAIIARAADCLIAIAGEYGTLSEIALALQMAKPVVTLDSKWKIEGTVLADSPETAVEMALRLCCEG
ncbi:MAG: TIGR00725 family protein [Halobacteriota archaeon]